jgi:hypothetical protein
MSLCQGQGQIYLLYILSWMYIDREMFYSVGFAQILGFCNASCGSAENMVVVMVMVMVVVVVVVVVMMVMVMMVMVMMVMVMMTMMFNRSRRGYLKTAPFETVHKTPQLLLHTSISVHRHTVNSSYRMPNSTLKVLYRNLPACHSICEEQQ